MATTVQQAVRPLLRIVSTFGLGAQENVYVSVTYNLAIWIWYACLYYYLVTAFKVEKLYLELNDMTAVIPNILSCVASVILSAFYGKKFRTFMKRLDAVDDTLAELGTLKMYRQLQRYIKITIIISFICCFIVGNMLDMKMWYDMANNHWCTFIPLITNHLYNVTEIVDVVFWTFLWYIGTRFEKINEHARFLLIKEEHGLRCTWRRSIPINCRYIMRTDNYKHIFWILMHLHLELCRISSELNVMFGVQITLELIGSVMMLTQLVTYILTSPQQMCLAIINFISIEYWVILYIGRLFYLNYLCETVCAKAKKIGIVHQLTHFLRYADIHNEIHQFTLHLIHHPLKFTGLGLFEFGYNFLKSVLATVATFVIMKLQR